MMTFPIDNALASGLIASVVMPACPLFNAVVKVASVIVCATQLFQRIGFDNEFDESAAVAPRLGVLALVVKIGVE